MTKKWSTADAFPIQNDQPYSGSARNIRIERRSVHLIQTFLEEHLKLQRKKMGLQLLWQPQKIGFQKSDLTASQDTIATLEITPPSRLKDGGPKLEGPLIGYFIYEGKRYTQKDTVTIFDSFEDRPIRIGMSVANKGKILLAGTYRYQVELILTSKQSTQEEPVIEDTE